MSSIFFTRLKLWLLNLYCLIKFRRES